MTLIKTVDCSECKTTFEIHEETNNTPGWVDKYEVNCPECGYCVEKVKTDGYIEVKRA